MAERNDIMIPAARLYKFDKEDPRYVREVARAKSLAPQAVRGATFTDMDCAATVFNTHREMHPDDPLEFALAAVWYAGKMRARGKS